ncbi:hypothetical protein HHK36_009444 [Tetracentron sinense]|uniref:CRAL-TRIO domain-containing protein n=1 Tax=Tetracentron sinense TaxID=13715 RepID=A0A834ZLC5_TETSI|nr:hypothetical protein HHK36_009444 [Tetracentron sinense]
MPWSGPGLAQVGATRAATITTRNGGDEGGTGEATGSFVDHWECLGQPIEVWEGPGVGDIPGIRTMVGKGSGGGEGCMQTEWRSASVPELAEGVVVQQEYVTGNGGNKEMSLTIMSTSQKKSASNDHEKPLISEEQQEKINEVRKYIGPLPDKLSMYCSDASISRHLKARNWNVKKATKLLKETLKWRFEYKPEEIRWGEVAHEAETGKIYRSNYIDKYGRTVLVMRPSCQNTKSTKGQIRYLVYCMENAILNLPPDQEQMVWLIDFRGFNKSNISVKVTLETAHVLQDHYPERLGVAILYNPPKFFESFWTVVKPFLEPKTYRKVKFVYSDDVNTKKIMEDLFDMDKLESAFGGNNQVDFDINDYAERMREDDKKMSSFWTRDNPPAAPESTLMTTPCFDPVNSESDFDDSSKEHADTFSPQVVDSEECMVDDSLMVINGSSSSSTEDVHSGEGTTNLKPDPGKAQ